MGTISGNSYFNAYQDKAIFPFFGWEIFFNMPAGLFSIRKVGEFSDMKNFWKIQNFFSSVYPDFSTFSG